MSMFVKNFESFLFGNNETKDGQVYGFLPFIGPALSVLLVDVIYIGFVFKIGPIYMEQRKPYDLKNVLKYYNLLQIVLNAYIAIMAIYNILSEEDIEVSCMQQLPIGHRRKNIEVHLMYLAYFTKYLDYFDTICFVLRKSYRQVNFLHVYHHLMMTSCFYIYIRFHGFGGHAAIIGVLNAIVHVFMYSYYLLSAITLKQSLWWKQYITILQLMQFCLMLAHQSWPILFRPDCTYPRKWLMLSMGQSGLMLIMFSHFYWKTYLNKSNKISHKCGEKPIQNENQTTELHRKLE